MNRIINPANYLVGIVPEGQSYCLGFGISSLTDVAKKNLQIQQLLNNTQKSVIITGKSGALKENTKGKYKRKDPPQKTSIIRHISYYSTRFGKQIEFNRTFNIWEKELVHQFNLELSKARTPQGETILHFPFFKMRNDPQHLVKAGAAMNIALLLGSYFIPYDENYEPIIPVTKIKDKSILPSGTYNSVVEKLEAIEQNIKAGEDFNDQEGNSYRFALLKEFKPDDVTIGKGGFNEYLMFEYNRFDLVVLENLKSGNATFLFRQSKFNKNIELNKQTAKENRAFLQRIVHENMEDWNNKMRKYFV